MPLPHPSRRLHPFGCPPRVAAAAAVLLVAGQTFPALAQQEGSVATQNGTSNAERRSPTLVERLTDSALDESARADAARALVAGAGTPGGLAALERVLSTDPVDDVSRALALRAVGALESPPEALWPIVRDLAQDPSPVRDDAVRACAAFKTRASARVLVGLLRSDRFRVASGALVRLTGRDEFGADTALWREWLNRVEALDEDGWRAELVGAMSARVASVESLNENLRTDTSIAFRRLYLATPDDERPPLLAEMLEHRQRVVRSLGFDLTLREISAGADLTAPVAPAARRMVASEDATVRANGAVLITRLAPPDAEALITRAIIAETDPEAAVPLLGACARWPNPDAIEPVLAWLNSDNAWTAATEAAWALHGAGVLEGPGERARVLDALHGRTLGSLGPAGLRLLVTFGDETDLHTVAGLLKDERNKTAAAEALTLRPGGVPVLLTAVQLDGTLFTRACEAVAAHAPTPLNFRVLQAATPADESVRVPSLLEVGRAMSSQALLELTGRLPANDPMNESLLVLLADPERAQTAPVARAEGLVRLAEIRAESGRAESALAVLPGRELFDPTSDTAARIDRVSIIANMLLGRAAEAQAISAPPSVWLDALVRVTDPATLLSGVEHVDATHGPVLTATERSTLESLRTRAHAAIDNPGANEVAGAAEPG